MAFLSRFGSILKQSVSKQIRVVSPISASNPSIYQTLRCMSTSKLFIGGLSYAVDDISLRETFSQYGQVIEAKVIIDREQNRSRGFGFVTFASTEEASSAIQAMDGQDLQGRRVRVNYAAERSPRPFSGGGGYGGGGYSGGGYGGGGYSGGQYGGGNTGGYGGGYNNSSTSQGVAAGVGDSFFGGGAGVGNVTADTGFGTSGFEDGASDQFRSGPTDPMGDDAGDLEPAGPPEGNFGDDEPDDFVKRA